MRALYKSILMGFSMGLNQPIGMEEDSKLLDRDVVTKMVDGIPSITFSDRVHKYIEQKMARNVIIKLLGGRVGFNALLNKISSMWSPRNPVQLMDMENDFYLVRFQDDDNVNKVLSGGSWVIFKQYLFVQPWSQSFL